MRQLPDENIVYFGDTARLPYGSKSVSYTHLDAINKATDNQKLIQILNNLREQMYRYRVEYLKNNEVYEQLLEEHEFLIQAVIKRDKAQAKDIICRHIDNQEKAIAEFIRNKKSGRD